MKPTYPAALKKIRLPLICYQIGLGGAQLGVLGCITAIANDFQLWQWIIYLTVAGICLASIAFSAKALTKVSILPFYSAKVPDSQTFSSGYALARNCLRLDAICAQVGVRTLSSFGFLNLPIEPESIEWNTAKDGIETVTSLLSAVRAVPNCVDSSGEVLDELQVLLSALCSAKELQIQFALVLRLGGPLYQPLDWAENYGTP